MNAHLVPWRKLLDWLLMPLHLFASLVAFIVLNWNRPVFRGERIERWERRTLAFIVGSLLVLGLVAWVDENGGWWAVAEVVIGIPIALLSWVSERVSESALVRVLLFVVLFDRWVLRPAIYASVRAALRDERSASPPTPPTPRHLWGL